MAGRAPMVDSFLTWGSEEQQSPEQGKEVPTALKYTEEELAKFTVDEHLNEVERTVLFLNGGQLIQQKHALANLPSVIKGRGRQAWEAIQGPLKSALNRLDTSCQIEAAEVFTIIAKERLMSPQDLQICLLPMIVRNINKEKSEEETEAWIKALVELIPMLDKEVLKSEVMSMALSKGDVEENVNSRVICAKILGAIAPYLSKDEVERSFLKKAIAMCQDVDYLVRISMCQQLAALGRAVGKELVLRTILDELFELLKDEEMQVRAAAFTSLIGLLDTVPPDVRKARVMGILRDHMQPFELDIIMQRCIARNFGQMMTVIKGELDSSDPQIFYGCFKHMASKPDVELRRACAQSFAALVKAAATLQPNAFQAFFADTLQSLAGDSDEEVRTTIATCFHEVARHAGRDHAAPLMTRPLVRLLRDESPRVQAATLPMLNSTLGYFVSSCGGDELKREAALGEVVRALTELEAGSSRNWRMQANLASAFPSFHQSFTSDQIYDNFAPMALRFLSSSAAAVRPSAAEGITCFLRYNRRDKQRADIFLKLVRDYARGKSYGQRLAFAEICKHIVRRFSSKFIKEWVFDLCLELLYDPVPNVRLAITSVLPVLKQTIRLPEDVDLLERLNNAISNSMTDNDRDVSVTARQINDTYKRMPVRMGGGITLGDHTGGAASYEAEDRKKEEEEAEFSFSPEDVKEIKAEILQMAFKKKAGAAEAAAPGASKSAINRRPGAEPPRGPGGAAFGASRSGSGPAATSGAAAASKAGDASSRAGLAGASAGVRKPSEPGSRLGSAASSSSASSRTGTVGSSAASSASLRVGAASSTTSAASSASSAARLGTGASSAAARPAVGAAPGRSTAAPAAAARPPVTAGRGAVPTASSAAAAAAAARRK